MIRLLISLTFGVIVSVACGASALKRHPLCGKLSVVRADADLKAATDRYGFKAYSYTDGTNVVNALHFMPKRKGTQKLPMVIYIPGNGEKGELIRQFRQRGIFDLVTSREFQSKHPCHLLALSPPESAETLQGGMVGCPTSLQRLLHDMVCAIAEQSPVAVDRDRLYMTGFSYGGSGAYALAQHFPGEYAAVVPIASYPPSMMLFDERHPGNWWHIHNTSEYDEYPQGMSRLRDYQEKTNRAGGDFRVGVYSVQGHDAWSRAWRETEVWDWMFGKSLDKASARKSAGARKPAKKLSVNLEGARCSASVQGRDGGSGPERVLDGLDYTAYTPEHAFGKKDWWMVEFTSPVVGKVEIYSGDKQGEGLLRKGFVEVSSNGKTWRRVGTFSTKDGVCSFTYNSAFSYLRIRPLGDKEQEFCLRRMNIVACR